MGLSRRTECLHFAKQEKGQPNASIYQRGSYRHLGKHDRARTGAAVVPTYPKTEPRGTSLDISLFGRQIPQGNRRHHGHFGQ